VLPRILTRKRPYPEREEMHGERMCPPHEFESAWATPADAVNHEDTVPGLYCKACGDVRAFRLPG
jgi:hypothetical protein